jgi:tetratricopeptide (TPR) repeat protein
VLDVAPNHVEAIASLGFIRRREGKWKASIALHERALEIDPRNVSVIQGLLATYQALRHYDKQLVYAKKMVELFPTNLQAEAIVAIAEANRDMSPVPVDRFVDRYRTVVDNVPAVLWNMRLFQARRQDFEETLTFLDHPPQEIAGDPSNSLDLARIHVLWRMGKKADAEQRAKAAIQERIGRLEKQPGNLLVRSELLWLYCVTGDKSAAQRALEKNKADAIALNDAFDGNLWRGDRARKLAWFGSPEEAVAAMRECLKYPNAPMNPGDRYDPGGFEPIADSAEIKALWDDKSAWAPIPIE